MQFSPTPCVILHMGVFVCQQGGHRGGPRAAEAREGAGSEEEGEGSVLWWLWETFVGVSMEVTLVKSSRKPLFSFSATCSYFLYFRGLNVGGI